jgi:hypothetical protein
MRTICSSEDHGYRDSTNPLRGLNLPRLVGLQHGGERFDAMIHSVIQRRRAAPRMMTDTKTV